MIRHMIQALHKPNLIIGALLYLFSTSSIWAQLEVKITGAGAQQIPIVINDFTGDNIALVDIVRADLHRSGLFKLVSVNNTKMDESSKINYDAIRPHGVDALAAGRLLSTQSGKKIEIRYRLHDIVKGQDLGGKIYTAMASKKRAAAHYLADNIYEKLIGEKGIFSTRIAYVLKRPGKYELQVADADGKNAIAVLTSREPIISPAWSPDGKHIAYVSFERKKPVVYVYNIVTGKRKAVANFKGSNSAPAWSPDGKNLSVVLTKAGGSQIFLMNSDGKNVRQISRSSGINTEPSWSKDGSYIYFTSDRGGTPQIYRMPAKGVGGQAERITFENNYNVSPTLSPNGQHMAYITRRNGQFQVSVMELDSRQSLVLTNTTDDESPSFSPNGRLILYSTANAARRGLLSIVSVDGRIRQQLSAANGSVRQPAWGPFSK